MTLYRNTAESGLANGTVVSTANSGGTAGDAFTAVGSGGGITYSSLAALRGSLGFVQGTATTSSYLAWENTTGATNASGTAFRFYFYCPALPTPNDQGLVNLRTVSGGTSAFHLLLQAGTGQITVQSDTLGTPLGTTTGSGISAGQWYRLEAAWTTASSTSQLKVRVYVRHSMTVVATLDLSGTNIFGTTSTLGGVRFGRSFAAATGWSYYFDEAAFRTGGAVGELIGPAEEIPPLTESWTGTNGNPWPDRWSGTAGTTTIQANRGRMVTPAAVYGTAKRELATMPDVHDTDVTATFYPTSSTTQWAFIQAAAKGVGGADWTPATGYMLWLETPGSGVRPFVVRYDAGGAETEVAGSSSAAVLPGVTWSSTGIKARLQVVGTTVRFKVWQVGSAEPGTWTATATDAAGAALTGKVSLLATCDADSVATTVEWDDLSVLAPGVYLREDLGTGAFLTGAARTSLATPTLAGPIAAGDLLVAAWAVDKSAGTFTVPSGWTAAVNTAGASVSELVVWRLATGTGDPTSVTATWSSGRDGAAAFITRWSGVNTADPLGPTANPAYSDTSRTSTVLDPAAADALRSLPVFIGVLDSIESTTSNAGFRPAATGWSWRHTAGALNDLGAPAVALTIRDAHLAAGEDLGSTTFTWTQLENAHGAMLLLNAAPLSDAPAPDLTAPTVPTGVTATATSPTTVELTWTASTDAVGVASYRVRRDGVDVTGATALTGTFFEDTGRTGSTTYSYTVSAVDAAGNRSAESSAATATTPAPADVTPPSVPSGVTATAVGPHAISVAWSASTDAVGVTSYRVRRNGVDLANAGALTGLTFTDTTAQAATTYGYTVSARDAVGNRSAESSVATATTPAAFSRPKAADPGVWSAFARNSSYAPSLALPVMKMQAVKRHLGVSKAILTTPFSEEALASLLPPAGLLLFRNGVQEFSGRVSGLEVSLGELDGDVIKVQAVGDEQDLADRLVFPDPLRAPDDQTVNDYWTYTGIASSAMHQLISDQAGPTCRVDRQVPGLVLGTNPGVGISRTWTGLFGSVLDQLVQMSVASGANLGLRMTSTAGTLVADIVAPRDLGTSVRFSTDLSNLSTVDYRLSAPEVTHAVAAGQGDLHLRLRRMAVSVDPTVLSWGRQVWRYVDRRDTADTAELLKAAGDAVIGGGAGVSLAVTLLDSEAATYARDWQLGDRVTVHISRPGSSSVATVTDVIREIAFTVDDDGAETIRPAIGDYDAAAAIPTPTQEQLAEVGRALAGLITRK
jgi:chitodextrinase